MTTRHSKYHATKVHVGDMVFDSRKEYERYTVLRKMEETGEIKNLQRQVRYELIPAQREPDTIGPKGGVKPGRLISRAVTYRADFVYEKDGETVVEDSKGYKTDVYQIKKAMMYYFHHIEIKES